VILSLPKVKKALIREKNTLYKYTAFGHGKNKKKQRKNKTSILNTIKIIIRLKICYFCCARESKPSDREPYTNILSNIKHYVCSLSVVNSFSIAYRTFLGQSQVAGWRADYFVRTVDLHM